MQTLLTLFCCAWVGCMLGTAILVWWNIRREPFTAFGKVVMALYVGMLWPLLFWNIYKQD